MATIKMFSKRKILQKTLGCLLIIGLLPTTFAFGQTASAPVNTALPTGVGYPTYDFGTVHNTWVLAGILSGQQPGQQQDKIRMTVPKLILKRILRELTKSITTWIDNGFEGNPSFVTDPKKWITNTADITVGDFLLNDPSLSFLCDPFKIQVKLALGLQYQPFKEQIKCSFSGALNNTNQAYNNFVNGDFINGGGWDSWLKLTTVPQNNQMGASILAQGELDARIANNQAAAQTESSWGNGFMSYKECTRKTTDASGKVISTDTYHGDPTTHPAKVPPTTSITRNFDQSNSTYTGVTTESCEIVTPGLQIFQKLGWADSSTIRELELADDINAIFTALGNQLLTLGMESLTGAKKTKTNDNSYNQYMDYLTQQQAQLSSQGMSYDPSNYGSNFYSSSNSGSSYLNSNNGKSQALAAVEQQRNIEIAYQQKVNDVLNLLNQARASFAAKTGCNSLIQDAVINRIDGVASNSGNQLSLNKVTLTQVLTTTAGNISKLDDLKSNITSASSDTDFSQVASGISDDASYHSSTDKSYETTGSNYLLIKNWLSVAKDSYNKDNTGRPNMCTADLSMWGI